MYLKYYKYFSFLLFFYPSIMLSGLDSSSLEGRPNIVSTSVIILLVRHTDQPSVSCPGQFLKRNLFNSDLTFNFLIFPPFAIELINHRLVFSHSNVCFENLLLLRASTLILKVVILFGANLILSKLVIK